MADKEIARDTLAWVDTSNIPDDIFFVVFHYVTAASYMVNSLGGPTSLSPGYPPWVLASVCRRWRMLALSTPTLWSTLFLPMSHIERHPLTIVKARLQLFLDRSSSAQLHVIIDDEYISWHHYAPLFSLSALIPLIRPSTSRWRSLKVCTELPILLEIARSTFLQLRSLDITACYGHWGDLSIDHTDTLHSVGIGAVMSLPLSWRGIHSFSCGDSFLPALPDMTELEVLRIESSLVLEQKAHTDQSNFPKLHTVIIKGFYPSDIPSSVKHILSSPIVRTLVLDLKRYHQHLDLGLLNITQFKLSLHFNIHCPPIPALLSTMIYITALYLSGATVTSNILHEMGRSYLPYLRSLRLNVGIMPRKVKEVLGMLEMRALSSTLQSVTELIFIRRGAVQSYTVETLGLRTKLLQRWYALREYMVVRYVEENEF